MSFWDVIWFIVVSFAFIAYLMVMFNIIVDLFRDKTASGWAKAAWMIGLIVVPFLTAVVYLVSRGRGMAERQSATFADAKAAREDYIRSVAGTTSSAEQIAQAGQLLSSGTISQTEFDTLKAKALA